MYRLKIIGIILLGILAVALWMRIGWNFYVQRWQAPLGPTLQLPALSLPGAAPSSATLPTNLPGVPIFIPQIHPTAAAASTSPAPFCDGPKTMTILAIGSDTRANNYLYGLADVIRYTRVDFVNPGINVFEFPRDLWVEIPGIEKHYGITHGKLNQAYFYGNPGMGYYNGADQGPGLLAQTLNLNFGARPDHFIAANMQTFVHLVDAIGGIDINLPFAVDARKPDQQKRTDLYFAPGPHHLDGEQALMFARIREYSVFARADQQNRVLCAMRSAVLNPANITRLPAIIASFNGAVQTDLSPQQISQLACLVPMLKPSNIRFTTFPRELLTPDYVFDTGVQKDVYIFKADFAVLRKFVTAFDLGIWPTNVPANPTGPTPTPRPRGEGTFACP